MESSLIILGAGKPNSGNTHSGLCFTSSKVRVLDWLINAFQGVVERIQFVGGYQLTEVASKYPNLSFIENPDWYKTGANASFLLSKLPDGGDLFVTYSDILYRKNIVKSLELINESADIVVAIDSSWKNRFIGRSKTDISKSEKVNFFGDTITKLGGSVAEESADAEFIGLIRFTPSGVCKLKGVVKSLPREITQANLSELVELLRLRGFLIHAVDVESDWAELNEPRDMVHFILGTKAESLDRLSQLITRSKILDQSAFCVADWLKDSENITHNVIARFKGRKLVIRSSALSEDGFTSANAGAYESFLNVDASNSESIKNAIEKVIASYADENTRNQILIQPMVEDVSVSGVAFTRVLASGAPYVSINYDRSGSTDSITSGSSEEHQTFQLRRDHLHDVEHIPDEITPLIPALLEIEDLLDFTSLDVEFAIDRCQQVYIFQVRPIATDQSLSEIDDQEFYDLLKVAEAKFLELEEPSPFVYGGNPVYGVMPDWNPAEIIGTKPNQLALSLYNFLITDETWATQRAEYGYRDVRPHKLLVNFSGHPYVDVRASFNSFVPASLSSEMAEKLVNCYLSRLKNNPHLHDKVEFEIVPTCLTLDFSFWEQKLCDYGEFSDTELSILKDSLLTITKESFSRVDGDLEEINKLEKRFYLISQKTFPPLQETYLLLDDCRRFGALPFAHLARGGFVAIALLRSAVKTNILSQAEVDDFLATIRTVSHRLSKDAESVATGNLSWDDFVSFYGHLRPGTYDVCSESYFNDPECYLRPLVMSSSNIKRLNVQDGGKLWEKARFRFCNSLKKLGLPGDPELVEGFLRNSIEGREYGKFIFTKNLSLAIDKITEWGLSLGLDRKQISYLSLNEIFSFSDIKSMSEQEKKSKIIDRINQKKSLDSYINGIELPPLISELKDFWAFNYPHTQPNFIGNGKAIAECIKVFDSEFDKCLEGAIVMIPQADPGFDWLFGQGISGLITKYGGANSHMAIRAAEFKLPAAIGIGEIRYQDLLSAKVVELNASTRQINKVS